VARPRGSAGSGSPRRQARLERRQRLDRSRELIRPGAGAKSQVWRVAAWLSGWGAIALLADLFAGSRRLLEWGVALLLLPFLLTVPYGLARLRGEEGYRPAARLIALRPVQLHVYVLLIVFGRLPMGIGDHLYTLIWRTVAHALEPEASAPDALEPVGRRRPPPERRAPIVVYQDDEPTDEHVAPRRRPDTEHELARRYPILFGDQRPASRPRSDAFAVLPDRSQQAGSPVTRALWRVLGR
jgi:hypothetical protein